jgi:hypothetical protein
MLRELGKIFGSEQKVKLLRFFLANPEKQISFDDLIVKVKIKKPLLKKEIKVLVDINFVTELTLVDEEIVKLKGGKTKVKVVKEDGYELNQEYPFVETLANLLLDFRFIDREEMLENFKRYGKIKLLCLGGVFKKDEEGPLDILVAGDALDKEKIDEYIKKLEADFGTELRYAVFESEEFRYRVNMFDRLIKDFLRTPHETVVEKISTRP